MKKLQIRKPKGWPEGLLGWGLLALIIVGLGIAFYSWMPDFSFVRPTEVVWEKSDLPPINPSDTEELREISKRFRHISSEVGAAVANITVKMGKSRAQEEEAPQEGNPFEDFFEHFGLPFNHPRPEDEGPKMGVGSGFMVDPSGVLITNFHVVDGADEILVRLANETTQLKAKIIGSDERTDLALIRLNKKGPYPTIQWADSDRVEVGDWAVAIGSPFALGQTVTVGIVSAKGRENLGMGADYVHDLIQTDSAINPGNSGGPLCNIDGRVMGVNTAIYSQNGGYMGIGFAIPANLAREISTRLLKEGQIVRGWLGVTLQPLDPGLAEEFHQKEGVSIHEVMPGSPAEKAGLQPGDIVIALGQTPVKNSIHLQTLVSKLKPGQKAALTVMGYSSRKKRTVTVTIGNLSENKVAKKESAEEEKDPLGLTLIPRGGKLVVEQVEESSPAAGILEPGDQILTINREQIRSLFDYEKLIQAKKHLYFEILRKGRRLFIQIVRP